MQKNIPIYQLKSENLTHLGGKMGTEYTYDNFTEYFYSKKAAKKRAEGDYKKPLKWFKKEKDIRTKDLGYVQYIITKLTIK